MNSLFVILAVVAVVLLFIGGFVEAVNFLIWIGIILLIVSVIAWLVRYLSGRRTV